MMVRVFQTGQRITHTRLFCAPKKDVVRKGWNGKRKIPELMSDILVELSQLKGIVQLLGKRGDLVPSGVL